MLLGGKPREITRARRLLLGIPLLYGLSAGPVVYPKPSGRIDLNEEASTEMFHYPLIRADERIPLLGNARHWYASFWERKSPKKTLRRQC